MSVQGRLRGYQRHTGTDCHEFRDSGIDYIELARIATNRSGQGLKQPVKSGTGELRERGYEYGLGKILQELPGWLYRTRCIELQARAITGQRNSTVVTGLPYPARIAIQVLSDNRAESRTEVMSQTSSTRTSHVCLSCCPSSTCPVSISCNNFFRQLSSAIPYYGEQFIE